MTYRQKIRWTAQQIQFVRENYERMTDEEIGRVLGKTMKAVRLKRQRIGIEKTPGAPVGNTNRKGKPTRPKDAPTDSEGNPAAAD